MAQIDASIPLSYKNPEFMSPAQVVSLQDIVQRNQERKEERPYRLAHLQTEQKMDTLSLEELQMKVKKSQAFLQMANQPGMIDENGTPTPAGIKASMAIDPNISMAWGDKRTKDLEAKTRMRYDDIKIQIANNQITKEKGDQIIANQTAVSKAFNFGYSSGAQDKDRAGNEAAQQEAKRLNQAGLMTDEEYTAFIKNPMDKHMADGVIAAGKKEDTLTPDEKLIMAATGGKGPGTPEYQAEAKKLLAKKDAPTTNQLVLGGIGALSPDTLRLTAEQYLAGDKSAAVGYARNPQMQAALRNEITKVAKEQGMSGKDIAMATAEFAGLTQGERTLGARQAQIEMAGNVVAQFVPLAKQRSDEYKRYGIKSVNDLQNAVLSRTSSPELRRLNASVNAVINAYARAINPAGVGTDSDKMEARKILDAGFANGDFDAAADQLMMEIGAELKAPGAVKKGMREFFKGEGTSKPSDTASPPATAATGPAYKDWGEADAAYMRGEIKTKEEFIKILREIDRRGK